MKLLRSIKRLFLRMICFFCGHAGMKFCGESMFYYYIFGDKSFCLRCNEDLNFNSQFFKDIELWNDIYVLNKYPLDLMDRKNDLYDRIRKYKKTKNYKKLRKLTNEAIGPVCDILIEKQMKQYKEMLDNEKKRKEK